MINQDTGKSRLPISLAVNGSTRIYGVIGDPISHSFSPQIHNTIAAALGHDLIYVPFHVNSGGLGESVKGAEALHIKGLNVTIPHKQAVMAHLSALDDSAQEVGSVNTLLLKPQGYVGYNTDCTGMYKVFSCAGVTLKDKTVMVLGAGGSAYAACIMAASHGASEIFIANRTPEHAKNLANHVNTYYTVPVHVLSYDQITDLKKDLVIQTSSLGFGSQAGASPVSDRRFFHGVEMALDIIYAPWETEFLRDARAMGVSAANGFDMLVYQAVAAYEIWQGITLEEAFVESVRSSLTNAYER